MLRQINLQNDLSDVIIKISVQTAANWEYDYLHKGNHYTNDNSQDPDHPFPHEYYLCDKNVGEIDIWYFDITNPSTIDIDYKTSVDWFQNGNQIHHWEKSGTVSAGTVVSPIIAGAVEYYNKNIYKAARSYIRS